MTTMTAAGAFTNRNRILESPTCCGAEFQIEATYADLCEALGETTTGEDSAPMWVVLVNSEDGTDAARVSIHHTNTLPREARTEATLWYVNCHRDERWAAERLAARLGKVVEFSY